MAERRYNARVVRAELARRATASRYVLRLLNDAGRVWTVASTPTSGAMH